MNSKYFEEAKQYIPGGVNSPIRAFKSVGGTPLFVKKGKGSRIYDENNHEYIDYCMSYGPLILGHANPRVISAVKKAIDDGTSFGAPTLKEIKLAKMIVDAVPSVEKVRLVNSGTEAVLSAVRLARRFTCKKKIIKFDGCYHGHVDDLLVNSGSSKTTPITSSNTLISDYNDIRSVNKLINNNRNTVAAVIVEPVAGNMGVVLPENNFLQELREITIKNNILLIFDEVITGFRVGYGGAQELFGVKPDITTLGKIIGGGFPVGAFGGRKDIMDLLAPDGPVYQAGTLSGNPVCVAAGIETLKILKDKPIYKKLEKNTYDLANSIMSNPINNSLKNKIRINCIASMFTLFFNKNKVVNNVMAKQSDVKMFSKFHKSLLKQGIYFPPSQFEACFLSASHSDEDMGFTINAAGNALDNMVI